MFFGKEIVLLTSDISQSNSNIIKKFVQSEISINKYLQTWFKINVLLCITITYEDKILSSKITLVVWKCPLCTAISHYIKIDIVIVVLGLLHYN